MKGEVEMNPLHLNMLVGGRGQNWRDGAGGRFLWVVEARFPLGRGKVSAHIRVTNGAGVPGARIVTDGARIWMDIATN